MDVMIDFVSRIVSDEETVTKFCVAGTLVNQAHQVVLQFDEPVLAEQSDAVQTTIKIQADKICLQRSGDAYMEQTFIAKQTKKGVYRVVGRSFDVETATKECEQHFETLPYRLHLVYDFFLNNEFIGEIDLLLIITEK